MLYNQYFLTMCVCVCVCCSPVESAGLAVYESTSINLDSSNMQESADRVSQCVKDLRMKLNPAKCKEMLMCLQRSLPDIPNILIEDKQLERVSTYKLLGVHISNDLTWNNHTDYLSKKAAKRIYFIRQPKRAGVAVRELVHIYVASIRSVIEYAAPVWFFPVPAYLIGQLEAIQRRGLKIILPE